MTVNLTRPPSTTDLVQAVAQTPILQCSEEERTIEGLVLPWGDTGATSTGSLVFPRGSLRLPADLSRVKLLAEHSKPTEQPRAIGHAVHAEDTEDGLVMRFKLGSSEAATEAMVNASEHVIDAFSIEAVGVQRRGSTVSTALLKAVAMVPFPAFTEARVHAELSEDIEDIEDAEDIEDPDASEDAEDAEDETTSHTSTTSTITITEHTEDNTMKIKRPATTPLGLGAPVTAETHASFQDITETIMAARNGELTTDEVHAALVDIKGSDSITAVAPTWLGELWSNVTYQRRIIPLLQTKALTGRKAIGMRWATDTVSGDLIKPGVGKWAGNKTEIPSKPAKWETVEVTAQPWAGGNDLDRQIFDFNEADVLRMYWEAMAESYAMETDADAAAFLADAAVDIQESAPDLIRAIARGAIRVDTATRNPATFAIINPLDLETVLDFSQLDVPHYTGLTPVSTPDKWTTSEMVAQGTALVGNKAAVTHYELAGSPLRAQAEHIARGGRDAALFGYTAMVTNRADALVQVHFDAAV